jgi:SP family general alpha glucoside:H+ symporter-like MFS transporter
MAKPEPTNTDIMGDKKNAVTMMKGVSPSKDSTGFEDEAALGTEQEKNMSLGTAFKYYRKAALWSVTICK